MCHTSRSDFDVWCRVVDLKNTSSCIGKKNRAKIIGRCVLKEHGEYDVRKTMIASPKRYLTE